MKKCCHYIAEDPEYTPRIKTWPRDSRRIEDAYNWVLVGCSCEVRRRRLEKVYQHLYAAKAVRRIKALSARSRELLGCRYRNGELRRECPEVEREIRRRVYEERKKALTSLANF